jgi:hypothetical protein
MIADQVTGRRYDYAEEFEIGLDLILDSLERRLASDPA